MSVKKQIDTLRAALVKCGKSLSDYAIVLPEQQWLELERCKGVTFDYVTNLYQCRRAKDIVIVPIAHLTDELELVWEKR